jgi:FKBP-type peptidyl-prolyl cis-trans isomerase SlyD
MQAAAGTVVSMNYAVRTEDGSEVDRSAPGQPLEYLHGHGNIIPGLERQIAGKAAGAKFAADIAPADAYGDLDMELFIALPKEVFPEEVRGRLQPGMRFQAEHPQKPGQAVVYTVCEVSDDEVKVDGNHPLAGKKLQFEIEIVGVRAATADEQAHGHVHGAHGHHHHDHGHDHAHGEGGCCGKHDHCEHGKR